MFAQLVHFDGPRTPEVVAASDRAGRDRIRPAVAADPQVRDALVATYVLRRPDGEEVVLIVAETAEAIARGNEIIAGTPLLPGEDPALLPGPDRVADYEVVRAFGRAFEPVEVRS